MEKVIFDVPGLRSDGCIDILQEAVCLLVSGVVSVEGDYRTRKVNVAYDPGQADLSRIERAFRVVGYTVAGRSSG